MLRSLRLQINWLTFVLCEAKMCCSGQPLILVGDLCADPLVVPSLTKSISDGGWSDWEKCLLLVEQFQLDEGRGTRWDFALVCPSAPVACRSGSLVPAPFCSPHGVLASGMGRQGRVGPGSFPIRSACWIQCTDRSRLSSSEAVQNILEVYLQKLSFVPTRVREQLRAVCVGNHVGASWDLWSQEAPDLSATCCLTCAKVASTSILTSNERTP